MSTFNSDDHPRNHPTGKSRFSEKTNSEPDGDLTEQSSEFETKQRTLAAFPFELTPPFTDPDIVDAHIRANGFANGPVEYKSYDGHQFTITDLPVQSGQGGVAVSYINDKMMSGGLTEYVRPGTSLEGKLREMAHTAAIYEAADTAKLFATHSHTYPYRANDVTLEVDSNGHLEATLDLQYAGANRGARVAYDFEDNAWRAVSSQGVGESRHNVIPVVQDPEWDAAAPAYTERFRVMALTLGRSKDTSEKIHEQLFKLDFVPKSKN